MTNIPFGMEILTSNFAVEQDGMEDREVEIERGGFWERLFDPDPTLPLWQKTKTKVIRVPNYKPAMYRVMDKFIVHPSLFEQLKSQLENRTNVYKW